MTVTPSETIRHAAMRIRTLEEHITGEREPSPMVTRLLLLAEYMKHPSPAMIAAVMKCRMPASDHDLIEFRRTTYPAIHAYHADKICAEFTAALKALGES